MKKKNFYSLICTSHNDFVSHDKFKIIMSYNNNKKKPIKYETENISTKYNFFFFCQIFNMTSNVNSSNNFHEKIVCELK